MRDPAAPWSFESAFRQSAGALAVLGLDGRWLEANDATCALLGRTRGQVLGRSLAAACEPEDALDLLQQIACVLDGARGFTLELRLPRLDGSRSWLRVEASRVLDARGRPVCLAVGLADVSDARRAREERDLFFDLCPDPLVVTAHDGRVLRVNSAWEALLEWDTAALRGRPLLDVVHPDDRARTAEETARVLAGRATPRFRNRCRTRAGAHRWLEWHSRVDEAGGRVYWLGRDVTEQQQALIIFDAEMQRRRRALEEAELRLGVHVNNTPLAVVEFDARLRVRRWSTRAEALFGWSEEEVIGDRPDQWRFIHEDDADTVATAMLALVTGESPSLVIENRNYTRDGGVVHCEWFMSAVFDDDGRLLSLLAFAQDVTARVRAQAEAAEREALFRATFEQAPVGIAHVGLDGRWLRVNDTLCRFLGYDAATLLATSFQQLTHPDDLDADLVQMRALLDGRIERYEMRKRYLHRDGHVLWAQLTVSLRRDAAGSPHHFISVVEDITSTVAIEQALERSRDELEQRVVERTRELESANRTLAVEVEQRRSAEAALRESEARIRTILENSHDAFVACDEDGRIVEWNRSAEAVFGWRRSEAVGRAMAELIIPARLRRAHEAGMARLAAGGPSRVLDQRLQLQARHRSGREFPVEVTISLVRVGSRRLFTAFLHDISERTAAEKQLRENEARLRMITNSVPALMAHVGPDLRYRFANDAYRSWLGRGDEDFAGLAMRDVLGAALWAQVESRVARARRGEAISFETARPDRNGVTRHLQVVYIPDGDAADGPCGFYIAAHEVTEHKRAAEVLAERALRDELTGLPNRAGWTQALDAGLARCERAALGAAVMFIDLDGFKQVNDRHGHDVGDAVLREFARRLRDCVRETDTVARLAGDEFVILLEGVRDPAQAAAKVASMIVRAMEPAFEIGTLRLPMAGSIGIAVQADGRFDRSHLLRRADEAMYAAKRAQGTQYAIVEA